MADESGEWLPELSSLISASRGHYKLESGHHGDLWLDLERLFVWPARVRRLALALAGKLSRYNLAAVCGPLVGGALVAHMVASELGVQFYYAERFVIPRSDGLYPVEYRLPASLRPLASEQSVAVVDDVINAGSAVRGTLADLRACSARPVVAGALLVLNSGSPAAFSDQGLPVESLASMPSSLWTPAECPLCASGVPLLDRVR